MKIKTIRKIEDETELNIVGATLLSIEEAKELPDRLRTHTGWWWLRTPGCSSIDAAYGYYNGSVYYIGARVDHCYGTVRPALQIENLESTNLKIGDSIFFDNKEFKIISDTLAFCKTNIGFHCFRHDRLAEDANDYEKSDVKKFVDKWFEEVKKRCSFLNLVNTQWD